MQGQKRREAHGRKRVFHLGLEGWTGNGCKEMREKRFEAEQGE